MQTWIRLSVVALVAIVAAGCGGGSDVGDQREDDPVAVAQAEGLGSGAGGRYLTRSLTDVLITGKNSDGVDDPLIGFSWRQTGGEPVTLFERGTNSRVFTTPLGPTTLEFELTVEDTDGATATDVVVIDVLGVADTNEFLKDPIVDETFHLFVSPDFDPLNPAFPAAFAYRLVVTPVVHWTDRGGNSRTQELEPVFDKSDVIDQGFVTTPDPVDPSNDRFAVPVPLLDIDEVNKFFQGENRRGRLEMEEVRNSRVELKVELSSTSAPGVKVYLARQVGGAFSLIRSDSVVQDPAALALADALVSDAGPLAVDIDLELLRQALEVESKLSASNYYDCIDPTGESATLSGWLAQAGFTRGADVVNTKYVNNYDLGFGRDMYVRVDADGSVYSYVVNYPGLEALLKDQGEFATVVMEYSAAPEGSCDNPSFSADRKIVKFYAYVPDTRTGEMVRSESMNFDGRGERFLPGVCTACHDGDVERIREFGNPLLADIDASNSDLFATFMPWDLDSFLYTQASDSNLIDPSLTVSEFSAEVIDQFSRESQEDSFRRMNEATLATYVGDLRRAEEPLRLIHGWYGNEFALPPPVEDDPFTVEDETDDATIPSPLEQADAESLVSLPDVSFDGSYVQPGWIGQEALYHDVFARNCRLCHAQQDDLAKNFDSYEEFVTAANMESYVFQQGVMPLSRLTLDRFWVDFSNGEDSAAEALRLHLNTFQAASIPLDLIPGRVSAFASADPSRISDVDAAGELVETTVSLFGGSSLFADSYSWMVSGDAGCPDVPAISGDASEQATMIVSSSPCELEVTLTVTDDRTGDTDLATVLVTSDRAPEALNFTAPLTGYTPGDTSLTIEILDQIGPSLDGDGDLTLVVNDSADPFNLPINPDVFQVSDSAVSITFPALAGTSDAISYQLTDVNGTLAPIAGLVSVEVPEIRPTALATSAPPTPTTISLGWTVPAGFVADSYSVERSSPSLGDPFAEIAQTAGTAYVDSAFVSGQSYVYRVRALLNGEESAFSNELTVSTSVGVPTALMESAVTATSFTLTWAPGVGTAPDGYTVYRDDAVLGTPAAPPFPVGGLAQNSTYSMQVSQTASGVESDLSAPLSVTTNVAPPVAPAAAAISGTTDSIRITWTPPAGGVAPGYRVLRNGSLVSTIAGTTFADSGLSSDTVYSYTVRSVGANGSVADSPTVAGRTNVSFANEIAPLRTISGGISPGVTCSGCHDAVEFEAHIRNQTPGCMTDSTSSIASCPASSHPGFTVPSTIIDLLGRWNAGEELP